MLGYLLRAALSEELSTGAREVIVITDTIPVNKKREAVEKSIQRALAEKKQPKVTYRILHHRVSGRLVRFCTLSGAFLTSVEGDRVPVSDGS